MSLGRLAVVVSLIAGGAVGPLLVRPQAAQSARSIIFCGLERWNVKTLQDRPLLKPTKLTTLRYLVSRQAPAYLPNRRLPLERNVFTVIASVVLVRAAADGDLHAVLQSGSRQMISEAPDPTCTARATPRLRRAMVVALSQVRVCSRARVTGVAFFDFFHGQTGVAPNAIELHPILSFRCLDS